MKKSFTIFTVLFFAIFAAVFVLKIDCEQAEHPCCECKLSTQLCRAVDMLKKVCTKNPNGKICGLLKNLDTLKTNIDADCIIGIGKKLEKDPEIKQASEKISKKISKKQDIIKRCFVQKDPKSFPKFERLLRNTTLKCGGFSFLWGKKETYQGAAFVAAAKLLEKHGK